MLELHWSLMKISDNSSVGKTERGAEHGAKYYLLACGTICSDKIDPSFFDCLPPFTELESEIEITTPLAFHEISFLDNIYIDLSTFYKLSFLLNYFFLPSF